MTILLATSDSADSRSQSNPQRRHHPNATITDLDEVRAVVHARSFAKAFTELVMGALDGSRPLSAVAKKASPQVFESISMRRLLVASAGMAARNTSPYAGSQVRSSHGQSISPGVVECSLLVTSRARTRAVAIRTELHGGSWMVTALEIG